MQKGCFDHLFRNILSNERGAVPDDTAPRLISGQLVTAAILRLSGRVLFRRRR